MCLTLRVITRRMKLGLTDYRNVVHV